MSTPGEVDEQARTQPPEATVAPGEIGIEAARAIRELTAKHLTGAPLADYVSGDPMPWAVLSEGGWDQLGVPEADGGGGANMRDLVEIAMAWGANIVPLPFVPSLLAKRWVPAARDTEGPVTYAVPSPATPDHQVSPFAGRPDILVIGSTGSDGTVGSPSGPREPDDYAPSLRMAGTTSSTAWSDTAVAEARAVWAGEAAGCARRILGDAVAYAKQRVQFDQPIGRFQAVQHQLADAHILAERSETAAIWAAVEPARARSASAIGFDSSIRVIETAIQVHGGLGFTWEMGLHLPLRHVVALRELSAGLDRR